MIIFCYQQRKGPEESVEGNQSPRIEERHAGTWTEDDVEGVSGYLDR